ncbi:MAG: hypothetical protein WCA12_17615, partial [Burkholderiales bacterium]
MTKKIALLTVLVLVVAAVIAAFNRADHRPREAGSPAYTDALIAGAIPPMLPKFGDENDAEER